MSDLERKVDDLQLSINRLSQQIDGRFPPKVQVSDVDDRTQDFSQDENEERGNWSGRLDFLLSCLGYAVGLGNVWRFPYLAYKNGGAVFFIPYCVMLFFVGMPIFFLELSLGQYTSSGPWTCWEMAPIFKGLGTGMVVVSALVAYYYNMIIAWALFYFISSFTSDLPWQYCDNDYNTEWCNNRLNKSIDSMAVCTGMGFHAEPNGVCYNDTSKETPVGFWNETMADKEHGLKSSLASAEYWNRRVLGFHNSEGIGDLGDLRWELVLCLLLAWTVVCLALIKGIKSSGKVVYFTALFPYVVLVILFVRGLTLDGHQEGIEFYILDPDLDKLSDAQVWKDAAVQIFFSLGTSWGGLIALASYNRFHNDCLRDSLIVSIGNCLTSFFAGFVIFSFLGYLAKQEGSSVDEVVDSGVGLAFIVYPYAVTKMPVSPLWSVLFFLMLITLGLDSEFALVETIITALLDQFPRLRSRKSIVTFVLCLAGFVLGLPLCTDGGSYLLQLMDTYSGGWNVLVIAFLECLCIGYVYGAFRYKKDIAVMLGSNGCGCFPWNCCAPWWMINWCIFTPAGVLFILIFSWYDYSPATYGSYEYPTWGDALGWVMTMLVIAGIFITMIGMFFVVEGSFSERFYKLTHPTKYWGPALPKHRALVRHLSPFDVNPHDLEDSPGNGVKPTTDEDYM